MEVQASENKSYILLPRWRGEGKKTLTILQKLEDFVQVLDGKEEVNF